MRRADGRAPDQLRPVSIETRFLTSTPASCLIRMGDTWVLCSAAVEEQGPGFLIGRGQGWVTSEMGQERATMTVQPNGNYKASTVRGLTSEGQFYLQDGKLLYRSSRTAGKAQFTEDKGKTTLTVTADNPDYGKAEYQRIRQ